MMDPGHLTDAAARNFAIKALRKARSSYRAADTQGERLEREMDRLIKRKTRINSSSMATFVKLYNDYLTKVEAVQTPLTDVLNVVAQF
jgi:hypothetical protein